MAAPYTDGTFTSAVQDGPYRKWYPFVNSPTKDTNTEGSIYSYVVLAANYVPGASNITAPHANTQYLVSESELTLDNAVGRFTRTFSEVPEEQTSYTTRVITKPTAASLGGNLYAYLTANYALPVIAELYTVNSFIFTPNDGIYSSVLSATSSNSGANTTVVTTSPHGLAGTEKLLVRWGTAAPAYPYFNAIGSSEYAIINTTALTIIGANLGANATNIAEFFRDYTAGTDRVGVKLIQNFYLPGVTPGINVATDIPTPTLLLNDYDFLDTLTSGATGYANYDASELSMWMGPIYTQTFIQINLDDV